jgi:acetyltransferase-like isoleucine patch superfamily enzyme
MIFFQKAYRFICSAANQILSFARIIHFRVKYPSLRIDFSSYLSSGVEIISIDGAICDIKNTYFHQDVYIKVGQGATLKIQNSSLGKGTVIVAHHSIEIKSDCSIAEYVVIRDQNHRYHQGSLLKQTGYETAPIILNRNVWLGAKCTVLKGVELGENVVVGAQSLVNKSFPSDTIVVGIPGKSISKD